MMAKQVDRGTWTKRCYHCGRVGTRAFEYAPRCGWACTNVDACAEAQVNMTVRAIEAWRAEP